MVDFMKRQMVTLFIVSAFLGQAVAFSGDDLENKRLYGEKLVAMKATPLSEVLERDEEFDKKEVTIEGTVVEVCQSKGCWMFIGDGEHKLRVDFKNYGFFVPWDSEGKRVRVQGKVYRKLVDKNVARHWAEESSNPDVKPEDITEDVMMVMLTAFGVEMENGSQISAEQTDVISGKVKKEH
jgi:hypothetical protein